MPIFSSGTAKGSRTATATVLGAIALGLIWLGATAPRAHSATAETALTERSPELAECPTRIADFRQADVWYRGRNRILVTAQSACGSRYGDSLDLKEVSLTIATGDRTYAMLRSPFGVYDPVGHQLLLGPSTGLGCVQGSASVLVNLKTGILQTPALRLALADSGELPECSHKEGVR